MGQFHYVIKDEVGIHARPAGMLVKLVKGAGCEVTVTKGEKTVDASKLIAVMGLGAKKGDEIVVSSESDEVLMKEKDFLETNL